MRRGRNVTICSIYFGTIFEQSLDEQKGENCPILGLFLSRHSLLD